MQPSFRKRARFFHEFAQLLKSGCGPLEALEFMDRGGGSVACRVAPAVGAGLPLGEALRKAGFPKSDGVIFDTGTRTGRLEEVCSRLADHYEKLADTHSVILTRSIYPIVLLHLTVVLLAIPNALLAGTNILLPIALTLGGVYLAAVGLLLAAAALRSAFAGNCTAGAAILLVPGLGFWFRTRSNARFARVFSFFVRSGGGLLRGLELAADSSASALLRRSAREITAAVRSGSALATAVGGRAGLSMEIERAIRIGDRSGRLDEETLRAAEALEARSLELLDLLAEWLPRILYLGIVLYAGWRILETALHIGGAFEGLLNP